MGQSEFGTRTEVKNLNSFRSLERAINFEIQRQIQVVEAGGTIVQQTMNFDDVSGETSALRSKENAHDYRYFPDPDLKPLIVTQEQIDAVKQTMPDLPAVVKARLQADYQLPDHDVKVLLQERHLFDYFNQVLPTVNHADPKTVSKWIVGDISALIKEEENQLNALSMGEFSQLLG